MITISVLQTLLKALLYAGVVAGDELVDYSEYKVVRMRNLTELRSAKLAQFLAREKKVQMWEPDYPSQVQQTKSADFLIEEKRLLRLREQFAPNEFEILIDDVEAAINEQKRQPTNINSMESMPYDIFLTYPQAERWLRETADKFPEMAQLKHLAKTEQGRDLWGLQIGKHAGNSDKRIFVDCGFHAREWIAPASCRYFINLALSAAYGLPVDTSHLPFTAEDVASLLDIDWFIMPFANPDGYEWTWIADRMWRKNRADYGGTCKGIDLNRNFPVGHRTGMGTTVECMITYADTTPISQPETKAWDSWIRELHEEKPVSAQISVHTYSQLLMPPWATGRDEGGLFASDPPNSVETRLLATFCILMSHSLTVIAAIINFRVKIYSELEALSLRMGDAILRTHGKTYEVGQSRDVVGYAAGGTTEDYAYHPDNGLDIPYAWVYELRDDGKYGFLLGPDEIIPTAEEVVASFIELRNHLFSQ